MTAGVTVVLVTAIAVAASVVTCALARDTVRRAEGQLRRATDRYVRRIMKLHDENDLLRQRVRELEAER